MSSEFLNPFTPGIPIQLADINELPAFEDVVAYAIDPEMTESEKFAWEGRVSIKELIRPPDFNGPIINIELTPLDDPYAKMRSLREDGWKLRPHGSIPGSSVGFNKDERARRCLGFHLVADAKSTGRKFTKEIQVGLWYLPVATTESHGVSTHRKQTVQQGGRSVIRLVTQPRFEAEAFMRLHEESVRIAFSALSKAMQHPLRNGMHN